MATEQDRRVYLKNKTRFRVSVPGQRGSIVFANPGQIVAIEPEALDDIGRPTEKRPGRRVKAGADVKRYFEPVSREEYERGMAAERAKPTDRVDEAGVPIKDDEDARRAVARSMGSKDVAAVAPLSSSSKEPADPAAPPAAPPPKPNK
jgi:hypothetical protein